MADFSLNSELENLVKMTLDNQEQTIIEEIKESWSVKGNVESAKSSDFVQGNNAIRKKISIKPYTTSRITLRKFYLHFRRGYQQGRFL